MPNERPAPETQTARAEPRGGTRMPREGAQPADRYETGRIWAGGRVFGDLEAEVLPFEDGTFDFERVNEYLLKNPAIRRHIVPDAIVSSCSECCMAEINGKPNILGLMFRKSRQDKGCSGCPVSMASEKLPARKADGSYLKDANGRVLSEADMVRMAEDGEK